MPEFAHIDLIRLEHCKHAYKEGVDAFLQGFGDLCVYSDPLMIKMFHMGYLLAYENAANAEKKLVLDMMNQPIMIYMVGRTGGLDRFMYLRSVSDV